MSLPLVSCCCLTYGRTERLNEALACFLAQDYPGPKELVIFNSLPEQKLDFSHPQVRIINLAKRPANLGATRNLAVSECRGEIILPYDDDDIYLPGYIRLHVEQLKPDWQWVFLNQAWKVHNFTLNGWSENGYCVQMAYRKKAWEQVGGYPNINSGEDREFRHKIQELPGGKIDNGHWRAVFGYGWNNGVRHVSSHGRDQPGEESSWDRLERVTKLALNTGRSKRGRIRLVPKFTKDWVRETTRTLVGQTKELLLVMNVVGRDFDQAKQVLEWAHELDGRTKHRLMLCTNGTADLSQLVPIAEKTFHVEQLIYPEVEPPGDSYSEVMRRVNTGFRTVARNVSTRGVPWLWWEPDAIPLKRGWVDTLLQQYRLGARLFMGPLVDTGNINGVAIYPPHPEFYAPEITTASDTAWDVAAASQIVPLTHDAKQVMPHLWGVQGKGCSFKTVAELKAAIGNAAVLFHRCKDGSAINVFRSGVEKLPHAYVQLGRFGDIINLLPVLKHVADQQDAPVNLVVAQQFLSVLDGVSYVKPWGFPGKFEELDLAEPWALERFQRITTAQVYGRKLSLKRQTESFCKESWQRAGHLDKWGTLPLVFDRRDAAEEEKLFRQVDNGKPIVLVAVKGHSSPFKDGDWLFGQLKQRYPDHNIVDLGNVNARRIYDLLGLYDRAKMLFTIDTATLHLAAASQVPVFEFLAEGPTPWHASIPKGNCQMAIPYSKVRDWMLNGGEPVKPVAMPTARSSDHPFLLVYSAFSAADPNTMRRHAIAQRTRSKMQAGNNGWLLQPVTDAALPRLFRDSNGRRLPYVRDLIFKPMPKMADGDYVVLTNTDTCLGDDLAVKLKELREKSIPCAIHRRDFNKLTEPLTPTDVRRGNLYCGWDLFAFSKTWWLKHHAEMPDMLLGSEAWDAVLSRLILTNGGVALEGYIYHERHASVWENSANRNTLASQRHNRQKAKEWLVNRGIEPRTVGIK